MEQTNTKKKVPISNSMSGNFLNKGIYCFKDKNTGAILYIGSTADSFKKRLLGHERWQTNWNLYKAITEEVVFFDLLETFKDGTVKELLEIEAFYIKQYKPFCNIQFKNNLEIGEDIENQIKVGKLSRKKLAQNI